MIYNVTANITERNNGLIRNHTCESLSASAAMPPSTPLPRHRECGSHTAVSAEISSSKFDWGGARPNSGGVRPNSGGARANSGGARPGAGRKPSRITVAKARHDAALTASMVPAETSDRWFCFQTYPRCETIALDRLVDQGFAAICPRIAVQLPDGSWCGRLMFPGYGFARFDLGRDQWRRIASTVGVRRLFGVSPERPVPVPPGVVEALIDREIANGAVLAIDHPQASPLLLSEAVTIIEGPFASMSAIVRMSAGDRVRLLIAGMGREIEIETARRHVVPVREIQA